MEITKAALEQELAEMERQYLVHFANTHRCQAVIVYIKNQLKQLDTPIEDITTGPEQIDAGKDTQG